MQVLELPIDLTPEDALVIARVLEHIVTAIWQTHGRDMAAILEAAAEAQQEELPF